MARDPYEKYDRYTGGMYSKLLEIGFLTPGTGAKEPVVMGNMRMRGFTDGSNLIEEQVDPLGVWISRLLFDALLGIVYIDWAQAIGSNSANMDDWLFQEFGTQLSGTKVIWATFEELQHWIGKKDFVDAFRI